MTLEIPPAQTAHIASGDPADLPYGGACAWRLSADAHCAAQARSVLGSVMQALAFPTATIEDGALAVSELATNAFRYATGGPCPAGLIAAPELWVWARTAPRLELVVAVFDPAHGSAPEMWIDDLMNEHGKGLGIVEAIVSAWGYRRTRSRLASQPIPGKAVWFTLPLPPSWPRPPQRIPPAVAAQHLVANLAQRGIAATRHSEATGISVITTAWINVWVCHAAFSWTISGGLHHRHPLIDLQEATEHVVRVFDESRCPDRP